MSNSIHVIISIFGVGCLLCILVLMAKDLQRKDDVFFDKHYTTILFWAFIFFTYQLVLVIGDFLLIPEIFDYYLGLPDIILLALSFVIIVYSSDTTLTILLNSFFNINRWYSRFSRKYKRLRWVGRGRVPRAPFQINFYKF